jgi:hypothetical protein
MVQRIGRDQWRKRDVFSRTKFTSMASDVTSHENECIRATSSSSKSADMADIMLLIIRFDFVTEQRTQQKKMGGMKTYTWAVNKIETAVSKIVKGGKPSNVYIKLCRRNLPKVAVLVVLLFDRRVCYRLPPWKVFSSKARTNDDTC